MKPKLQPQQPQYYTAIIQFPDPDRLAKLLELGDPNLFDAATVGSNNSISFIKTELPKLRNASVTTEQASDRLVKLLELGDVNSFGGSPTAEALAARQRDNRQKR